MWPGRAIAATLLAFLAVTVAGAQTGGIEIGLTDSEGRPIAGATVTISHETGSIKTTAEISDRVGVVSFPVLRPGQGYSIQIVAPGFSPIVYDAIRVRLGETLELPVQMMDEISEQVTVTADSRIIELDKSESSTRFDDDFIANLPVRGRFYQNVLTKAPGVQDADGDGNPNVHGSRARDFQAIVSGVSNVDPLTGQWLSRINPSSIEELEIITAGAGVEFGRAQGGFARIIQKQGNNTHEGVFELYWQTSKLDGDGANDTSDAPDAEFETWQPMVQLSGPLKRDKLWYRFSYERRDTEIPINVLSGIEILEQNAETQDAQLTWQVSPRNKLALQFRVDPSGASNVGVSSRVPSESSLKTKRDVETWTVNWTAPQSPKALIETTLAWQDVNPSLGPTEPGVRNDCVPNAKEAFFSEAYCVDLSRNTVSGPWPTTHRDHRQRLTLKSQATVYARSIWGMEHKFKLGLNVENERYFRDLTVRPRITYDVLKLLVPPEEEDDGPTFEQFGRVVSQLSVPQSDRVRATGTNWALYAEDQFKPLQNLTLTLGARLDREEINSEGRAPFDPSAELAAYIGHVDHFPQSGLSDWPEFFTGYENIDGFKGLLISDLCKAGDEEVDASCATLVSTQVLSQSLDDLKKKRKATNIHMANTNISPFVSAAWSPGSNGKTALKAAAGRYYNNIPLIVPLQELQPVLTTVEYWASLVDPDECEEPDPDEDPPEVPCGQTRIDGTIEPLLTIQTVDRDLKTPYQDEFTFKFERELWAETVLGLTYVSRRFRDQIQDVNINVASGDLGWCHRMAKGDEPPVIKSPGTSSKSCSATPIQCSLDAHCPAGETCGYFFDVGDWLTDPYTGETYPDTNPGDGDGYRDPLTGSADDNCTGVFEVKVNICPPDDPFCVPVDYLRRPDDVSDLYLQNPFWGDVRVISNVNSIDYEAIVLELVRRRYRGWEMNASYTWSEAKGDGEDFFQELAIDPTLRENEFGFQAYDQRHVVKLNAATVTPWGVRLGTAVTWQSGLPYSLLTQRLSFDTRPPITQLFGGAGSRPRQTYSTGVRNDQRNKSYWNVDLKATKELSLGRNVNLQLSAEIFNMLDDDTYQIYNPGLGRGVQINGENEGIRRFGRRWQVGMKVAF